jgi:hypothetical protein
LIDGANPGVLWPAAAILDASMQANRSIFDRDKVFIVD